MINFNLKEAFDLNTLRIAILGPESSGKTTLANALANQLDAFLSPEFARKYLKKTNGHYDQKDLDFIAKQQFQSNSTRTNQPFLIADTEMITLKIWSKVKYDSVSETILELLDKQQFDLYLLCKPDLPWEADPLREHPEFREELFRIYKNELQKLNMNYQIIEGTDRTSMAVDLISKSR